MGPWNMSNKYYQSHRDGNSESEGVDNVYATHIHINTEVRLLIIIIIITYRMVYGAI